MRALARLALALVPWTASAVQPVEVTEDLARRSLIPHTEILTDPERTLDIDGVVGAEAGARFSPPSGTAINFGHIEAAVWVRFALSNRASSPREVLLDVDHRQLDHVVLYTPGEDGSYTSMHQGDSIPVEARPLELRRFVFPILVRSERTEMQLDGLTHGWWRTDSDWQQYCVFASLASVSVIQFTREFSPPRVLPESTPSFAPPSCST